MSDKDARRMLLVLAHPDDESFGMAGTIARYVADGVEVSLICTTNGDVGTADPKFLEGYASIAEMRLAELKCASDTLRMTHVVPLGYRDSGMAGTPDNDHPDCLVAADLTEVIRRITQVIRELRPHVVVTFDPYGGYGHPDHIVTHNATVNAFEAAPDPAQFPEQLKDGLKPYQPQKLYFMTFDRRILKFMIGFMATARIFGDPTRMGRNKDVDARQIAAHSYPIHATINTQAFQEIANRARRCHASQLGGIGPRRMSQMVSALVFGVRDHYMRYYPPVNGHVNEHDLFEGVTAD